MFKYLAKTLSLTKKEVGADGRADKEEVAVDEI